MLTFMNGKITSYSLNFIYKKNWQKYILTIFILFTNIFLKIY